MPDIDLNKIRQLDGTLLLVLRELLRQRRTTLVAQQLGLSQSAVSHALSRLRELFGDPLFVRRQYGLQPTGHALELGPRVDALLHAMGEAMGGQRSFAAHSSTRSFRIAAPDHLTTSLAPALLCAFRRRAPQARFAFGQRLGVDALHALQRDELDLALGRFNARIDGLVVEPLFDDHYCLVARRNHRKLRGKLTRTLYAELDHVQVSVAGDFQSPELEALGAGLPERRVVAAVPRFLIAFAVVAQSDAVAIAPSRVVRAHARQFGLRMHPLPFQPAPLRVLAVRQKQPDPGVDWLLQTIKTLDPEPGRGRNADVLAD